MSFADLGLSDELLRAVATSGYGEPTPIQKGAIPSVLMLVFAGAVGGVLLVQAIGAKALNLVIPVLLVAAAIYILLSPRMTDEDAHHRVSAAGYAPIGGAIGFYDGFFGPGTGTFFTTTLVGLRGYGLTRATALTKALNFTSNVASVLFFAIGGKMLWLLGLCMASNSLSRLSPGGRSR